MLVWEKKEEACGLGWEKQEILSFMQREGLKGEGVGELRRAAAWGWGAEEGSRSRGESRVEGVNSSCSLFSLSLQEQRALGVAQA